MAWFFRLLRWRVSRRLIIRYNELLMANAEEDPGRSELSRHYWLGRRHELKFILEQLGIPVPPLKLASHDAYKVGADLGAPGSSSVSRNSKIDGE